MKYVSVEKLIDEIERRKKQDVTFRERSILIDIETAIASLQQEQPSLPSNLDEAAENIISGICPISINGEYSVRKQLFDVCIAVAEWMAGQGVTKEAVIGMATEEISINVSQQTLDELDLCPGDKVVVQIRKK